MVADVQVDDDDDDIACTHNSQLSTCTTCPFNTECNIYVYDIGIWRDLCAMFQPPFNPMPPNSQPFVSLCLLQPSNIALVPSGNLFIAVQLATRHAEFKQCVQINEERSAFHNPC